MANDKPFEVGDRVILMQGRHLLNARETRVEKVYKTGNFTIEGCGKTQFRNPSGLEVGGDVWSRSRAEHWTAERAAEISRERLAMRVDGKVQKVLRLFELKEMSTDQLCRIEALLDKITEEREKEGKDA